MQVERPRAVALAPALRATTLSHERMWEREHTPVACGPDGFAQQESAGIASPRNAATRKRWVRRTASRSTVPFPARFEAPNVGASAPRVGACRCLSGGFIRSGLHAEHADPERTHGPNRDRAPRRLGSGNGTSHRLGTPDRSGPRSRARGRCSAGPVLFLRSSHIRRPRRANMDDDSRRPIRAGGWAAWGGGRGGAARDAWASPWGARPRWRPASPRAAEPGGR
jgi:hypothetical protein